MVKQSKKKIEDQNDDESSIEVYSSGESIEENI